MKKYLGIVALSVFQGCGYWKTVPSSGHSGSTTLGYGSGKSTVRLNYGFIRQ